MMVWWWWMETRSLLLLAARLLLQYISLYSSLLYVLQYMYINIHTKYMYIYTHLLCAYTFKPDYMAMYVYDGHTTPTIRLHRGIFQSPRFVRHNRTRWRIIIYALRQAPSIYTPFISFLLYTLYIPIGMCISLCLYIHRLSLLYECEYIYTYLFSYVILYSDYLFP